MKKRNLFTVILACAALLAVGCKKDPIAVTGITVTPTTLALNEGETSQLTATVAPVDAADQTYTWSSDDTNVATVSSNGVVTAVKAGTAYIKATTTNGKSATCVVTVNAKVSGVTLDRANYALYESETVTLKATISPDNASNKEVTWSTSDASIATVSGGVVTALKAGKVTITATTVDGGKTATCAIEVWAHVASLTLDKTEASMNEGETVALKCTINPSDAHNQNLTWSTSDADVATVNNGTVTGVNVGTATITVTSEDGAKTATCTVTVLAVVTGVKLDRSTLKIMTGQTGNITANVLPAKASNKNVTWTTSDASIATVENGIVTGVKAGTATITAKTEDGGFTDSCVVTITDANGFGNQDYNKKDWNW